MLCFPASASVLANSDASERAADAAAGWCWCCLFAVHGRCWCSDAAERKTHMHPQLSPTKDTIITADILMAMMRCEDACMLYASLCCRLTHHITRFALLNVFGCKQLNFSWTTINPWKGVETLDKCNSYSLWNPFKTKTVRWREGQTGLKRIWVQNGNIWIGIRLNMILF